MLKICRQLSNMELIAKEIRARIPFVTRYIAYSCYYQALWYAACILQTLSRGSASTRSSNHA